jgi:hypothetical protein
MGLATSIPPLARWSRQDYLIRALCDDSVEKSVLEAGALRAGFQPKVGIVAALGFTNHHRTQR